MTSLRDLLERVKKATDRLDDETLGRLICAVQGVEFGSADIDCGDDGSDELSVYGPDEDESRVWSGYRHLAPDVSVDAALALIGAVLPGLYKWRLEFDSERLANPHPADGLLCWTGGSVYEGGATPALALCAALTTAKIEQEGASQSQPCADAGPSPRSNDSQHSTGED
jgi:hypothetical protein